jgi:UDP-galactopyranose mutase
LNVSMLPAQLLGIEPQTSLICFSHLRWDFVLQRPQHLMERFARHRRVFYFEEPIPVGGATGFLEFHRTATGNVDVVRPRLPDHLGGAERDAMLAGLVEHLVRTACLDRPVLWFYTPMMLPLANGIEAGAVVYDCMDELANFKFAPPDIAALERQLLERADVVFTGGHGLFDAKRHLHGNIHPFPSSVDVAHFAQARAKDQTDPADQARIPHPRLGFYGVIDERIDLALLRGLAESRPDWSVVMIGPTAKIDPVDLPRLPNIHYLGNKPYADLPGYLAGWDVALMPFAVNAATRFISPTKTPEYLAGGRPVVSTPVPDVVRQFSDNPGVLVGHSVESFVGGCETALGLAENPSGWRDAVDTWLADQSWDTTFARMRELVDEAVTGRRSPTVTHGTVVAPAVRRMNGRRPYDVLVVGAGFAGSVLAERLAAGSGQRVLLCDRRPHVGGNAYDHKDAAGILVHRYGPHIFHTNSSDIVSYLSRFTKWRPYEHRVLASVGGRLLPVPINRTTVNGLYGLDLTSDEAAQEFLASRAEPVAEIRSSRDVVVSHVGTELYETFFEGYTRKQWGIDASELDKSVTSRVPTRTNTDDRYFTDSFQAMPAAGYTAMFETMLDHDGIALALSTDYAELEAEAVADRVIFTGPIDEFFGHRCGALPYRSLDFRHETLDQEWLQPVGVVNYPSLDVPFTRITEYKHLTGQSHGKTSISYETPQQDGDPYYPIPRAENQALYKRYEALAKSRPDVSFVGRLATYRYYNMDQVVGQALATYRRLADSLGGVPAEDRVEA